MNAENSDKGNFVIQFSFSFFHSTPNRGTKIIISTEPMLPNLDQDFTAAVAVICECQRSLSDSGQERLIGRQLGFPRAMESRYL